MKTLNTYHSHTYLTSPLHPSSNSVLPSFIFSDEEVETYLGFNWMSHYLSYFNLIFAIISNLYLYSYSRAYQKLRHKFSPPPDSWGGSTFSQHWEMWKTSIKCETCLRDDFKNSPLTLLIFTRLNPRRQKSGLTPWTATPSVTGTTLLSKYAASE